MPTLKTGDIALQYDDLELGMNERQRIVSLIDLTSLNDDDTEEHITALCQQALTPLGPVAAVCVYPQFVKLAKSLLDSQIKIATVANFPCGDQPMSVIEATITTALAEGADEIDVVIPYQTLTELNAENGIFSFVQAVKATCAQSTLKVILESGALSDTMLTIVSNAALNAGADFLKTSTGKIGIGATETAAKIMLKAICDYHESTGKWCGFKASGGVKTLAQAKAYISLAEAICGKAFISPETMRFGASSLLKALIG